MAVRVLSVLLFLFILIAQAACQTTVTVAQLEQFLTSSRAAKLSDDEIARRLSHSELSEQLTGARLARIVAGTKMREKTAEQLEILGAASLFEPAPASDLLQLPSPDEATQKEMLKILRDRVGEALHVLPDFLAMRVTRSFDNAPISVDKKRSKPIAQIHFVQERRSEIAVRSGREVNRAIGGAPAVPSGLSSWGEFGAILTIALSDSFSGSVQWARWQRSDAGKRIAVFHYQIPQQASHYTVDFCCYRKSQDDPTLYPFHEKPGYEGEIFVDADSGKIDRITLEAELSQSDPVTKSVIAVQYGDVSIDGRHYVCPVRSVAISEIQSRAIEKIDGIGIERRVNEERFIDYHKFGSTMRVVGALPEEQR